MRMSAMLTDLKLRYPTRVHLLLGTMEILVMDIKVLN